MARGKYSTTWSPATEDACDLVISSRVAELTGTEEMDDQEMGGRTVRLDPEGGAPASTISTLAWIGQEERSVFVNSAPPQRLGEWVIAERNELAEKNELEDSDGRTRSRGRG